jgi:membrane protein YdbS with pleckstrin-like domain
LKRRAEMSRFLDNHLTQGEKVIFDKRHSLWDIWMNFLIGIGALIALIFLLTKFKPGTGDSTGYVILISVVAAFFFLYYGAVPFVRRRFFGDTWQGRQLILPITAMILVAGIWSALMWFRNDSDFADIWKGLVWILFFLVVSGWLVYPILRWYFQHFILTDRRLILHEGILSKRSIDLPLDQVNDIRFKQNPFERVLRYGDIVIESASEYGQQPFTNIGNPEEIKKLILQQRHIMEEDQSRRQSRDMASEIGRAIQTGAAPAAPAQAPPQPSGKGDELEVVDGLKKLADLRQSGALSEEEFQRAKKELMDKLEEE